MSKNFFFNNWYGAPKVTTNTAQAYIDWVDGCLVTGFGSRGVTYAYIADGIATLEYDDGGAFQRFVRVQVDGLDPEGLNGVHQVIASTETSVSFETDLPDGPVDLDLATVKYAPLGWERVYSGSGKAVYKSPHSPTLWRLEGYPFSSNHHHIKVRTYQTMSDIDTGTDPWPSFSDVADELCGVRLLYASSPQNYPMAIVGDDRIVYFLRYSYAFGSVSSATSDHMICAFGQYYNLRNSEFDDCIFSWCELTTAEAGHTSGFPGSASASNSALDGSGRRSWVKNIGIPLSTVSAARCTVRSNRGVTGVFSGSDNTIHYNIDDFKEITLEDQLMRDAFSSSGLIFGVLPMFKFVSTYFGPYPYHIYHFAKETVDGDRCVFFTSTLTRVNAWDMT